MHLAGNAVTGITGPMDYKYMKVLRFVLRIISGWPGKALGEKTLRIEGMGHAYYNTILSLVYLALGIAYLKKNFHRFDFLELGQLYIVLLMNMLSTSRAFTLCLSQKYREVAKIFIQKIHLFYFKEKSDYAMKIHVIVHKISFISAVYLSVLLFIAAVMFNLIPMYNNYSAGRYSSFDNLENTTYEQAISCLYPWNFETNFNGYLVATLSGWYGTMLCGSSVSMFDLFLCLMIFNLWGHFKILIHNLEHFPRPASEIVDAEGAERSGRIIGSEMYSQAELEQVAVLLRECIQYHMLIFDFTNNMSDAFGMALFIYYSFHQITGCLLLLECSQMTAAALTRYLPLTIIMFGELVLLSIIFETIGTMSEKLKDAVYKVPWEYMDTKNRRTLLIFLIKVQEPIHVKAGGLVDVGVTTMASILKTSFSYFAFLRTF
uniref:Odorant receptor n=1 Tax=Heliothis virescens TaxID=7102 RepID=Q6A1K3_HELVI|nr:olfactory receptor OR11 [Heliothis virescens]CAG38112.1 putative chemosensory receptor 11 [Heliothis virescens]